MSDYLSQLSREELEAAFRELQASAQKLQEERDNWYRIASDRKAELEVQKIFEQAYAGGFQSELKERMMQLIKERNDALEARDGLGWFIGELRSVMKNDAKDKLERLNELIQLLREVQDQQGIDKDAHIFWTIYRPLITAADKEMEQVLGNKSSGDKSQAEAQAMLDAVRFGQVARTYGAAITVLAIMYGYSDDVRIIAQKIIAECYTWGTPLPETLRRLKPEWVESVWKRRAEIPTLIQAITTAFEYEQSGKTPSEFAQAKGIEERTLYNYRAFWAAICEAEKVNPMLITEAQKTIRKD